MAKPEDKPSALRWADRFVGGVWLFAAVTSFWDWLLGRQHRSAQAQRSDVHYEPSDINVKGVALTGLGVLLLVYVVIGIVWLVFHYFAGVRAQTSPPPLPIAAHGTPLPPYPRLQSNDAYDLHEFRAAEDAQLNSYRWLDPKTGAVSIPIDRAMDLIVERGIPPQTAPPGMFYQPHAGSRMTGFEGKVEPEPQ